MQPELLYLKDQPYTRLYVEVDVMEGIDMPQEWLEELEAFLTRHCRKPGGITMVRDEPVPTSVMTAVPMDFVAIMCMDGPPADETDQPAYLHVVFYDSNRWPRQRAKYPHVRLACPTAILCDVDYGIKSFKDKLAGAILRHEAGHVLGLCKNRKHGNGAHCRNYGCLMERAPDIGSQMGLIVGASLKNQLCDACERDLTNSREQAGQSTVYFLGPLLVRHESQYDVLRLPGYDILALGSAANACDWRTTLMRAKETIRKAAQDGSIERLDPSARSRGLLTCHETIRPTEVEPGSALFMEILTGAARDPCPQVRKHARRLLDQAAGVGVEDKVDPTAPREPGRSFTGDRPPTR